MTLIKADLEHLAAQKRVYGGNQSTSVYLIANSSHRSGGWFVAGYDSNVISKSNTGSQTIKLTHGSSVTKTSNNPRGPLFRKKGAAEFEDRKKINCATFSVNVT